MSIWGRAKAKAEELLGRAEQVYGESHGDAAATMAGEAHLIEAEAQEEATQEEATQEEAGRASEEGRERGGRPTDDDGLAGAH